MKKTGILILAVIMALGALGVGYAAWSQTLTITGTVETADFDVNFTANTNPTAPTGGTATSSIAVTKAATLDVTNVYPGYSGNWKFTVTNSSSIPVSATLTESAGDTGNMFTAVPAGPVTIAALGTQEYTVSILVPDWTGNSNQANSTSFGVTYTIVANQAP